MSKDVSPELELHAVLLFPKANWRKREVESWLVNAEHTSLRSGFSHFLTLPAVGTVLPSTAQPEVIQIYFDHDAGAVRTEVEIIGQTSVRHELFSVVCEIYPNTLFDLQQFGVHIGTPKQPEVLHTALVNCMSPTQAEVATTQGLNEALTDQRIPATVRRYLLDLFALRATVVLEITQNSPPQDVLKQYKSLFTATIAIRAMIDKLMRLVAMLDPAMNERSLSSNRSVKRAFSRAAKKSQQEMTRRMVELVENVEILDDAYRSPEVHKHGRLLAIVDAGHYGSAVNELMSFLNGTNSIMPLIINQVLRDAASMTESNEP